MRLEPFLYFFDVHLLVCERFAPVFPQVLGLRGCVGGDAFLVIYHCVKALYFADGFQFSERAFLKIVSP